MKDQNKKTCCEICYPTHSQTGKPYSHCPCHQEEPPRVGSGWILEEEKTTTEWEKGYDKGKRDAEEESVELCRKNMDWARQEERQRTVEKVWDAVFDSYPSDMENFDTRTESQSDRLLESFWGKLEALTDKEELKDNL